MQGAAAVQAEKGKGTTGVTTGARKTAVTAPIRVIFLQSIYAPA